MEQLINFIIRPPRAAYDPNSDLLDDEFILKGKWYQRKDLEVLNSRGYVLKCSHYLPLNYREGNALPCVIYCHGNSGSRTDASEAAVILLPSNITVFTLDFSGSGLSGGDHVTLGWNEKDDLRAVVDYLRSDANVSLIGLWGRSMGAVTSLMYGAEDPSIAGMVLDSPFSDLVDLMMELVDTYKVRLPKFTVKFAIQYMRRAVQKKAKFDITDLNTIKVAKSCFVPVLFGHAIDDDFVDPHHSDRIFDAYVGDKNIIKFDGDHNSPRPQFYFDSISIFFNNVLQPPQDEVTSTYAEPAPDYFKKGRWTSVYDVVFSDESLDSPTGSIAACADDAMKELRSKRPMSSIVIPADISSKNNQPDSQVPSESRGSDSCPSSSNMLSFELSKVSSSHESTDDDEYVEYPLDISPDFPTNVEEEERMLMAAVLESLKDVDPQKEEEGSFSTHNSISKAELVSTSEANDHKLDSNRSLTEESPTKLRPSPEVDKQETCSISADHAKEEGESRPTSDSDSISADQRPSSAAGTTGGITVTLKVEKSPTTNILDGLLRRWDLNCFRSR